MKTTPRICIIGAGVVGLSTAVQIQEALPQARIVVVAERFNTETLSDGAAGIFRPTGDLISGQSRSLVKKWCEDSYKYFREIAVSAEASEAGITFVTGNHCFIDEDKDQDPMYKEIVDEYYECSTDLVKKLYPHTESAHFVSNYTTLLIECRWFLPWLAKRLRARGGQIQQRKVHNLEELADYDIVVNCAGLGSKDLVQDPNFTPIRGQMIRVKAPWIKRFLHVDNLCYIIPGKETVIIGGTRQKNDLCTDLRAEDSQRIWQQACKYMPSLQKAEWQWEWVGLRPVRSKIRVEAETVQLKNSALKVVHNYGHGGNGVGLSWGTGKEATQLVVQMLYENTPAKL